MWKLAKYPNPKGQERARGGQEAGKRRTRIGQELDGYQMSANWCHYNYNTTQYGRRFAIMYSCEP